MVTDADRLLAAGVPLTIAGNAFHVRYTPRSLKLMEDRYGSLLKIQPLFEAIRKGEAPSYETVFFLLSLGLRHEKIEDVPVTEDWLLDEAAAKDIETYVEAIGAALAEAFPAGGDDTADPTTPAKSGTNGSTGKPISGLPSRISTAVPKSSGTG